MAETDQVAGERSRAAEILRRRREAVLDRWLQKVRLLAEEKGADGLASAPLVQRDAAEFMDLLLARLEGRRSEADVVSFYHLILDGRQYDVRFADLAYVLLELKSVSKSIVFEEVSRELQAFRISREVDDTIEAVLRKTADLYELTSEADYKTAQERLQEIFTAWELEESLTDAQTTAEVFERVRPVMESIWGLVGLRLRLYGPGNELPREFAPEEKLPIPAVREQRQYLSEQERQAGGTISLAERVRRRRESFICRDVRTDERVVGAPELIYAGARSIAACPLIARDRVAGVLVLYGAEEGEFGQEDQRRLADLAGVLALALDRAMRLERSHKEMSESEVAARIGTTVLELPSREGLLEGVVEALQEFRDYFDVSLFRVDRQAGECVLVAESGRERRYRPDGYRQPVGEGYIGLCAESGDTIRAWDLEEDQRRLVAFEEEYLACSELAIPVKRGDEVFGVLHVLSDREEDFPQTEVVALENVSPHIGVALQNVSMIDQRQRDRYKLERAHRQLSNIVRSTAVGITSSDERGVYTRWSPSCEEMLGYAEDEVVGRMTSADFAASDYDLQEALEECRREGRTTMERTMVRKDGTPRTIRETRVPMEDKRGRHIGFTSYLMDVTEQKRAEQELRRERDMLNLVVGAVGAGLAMFDHQLRLQWANVTLMEWFGFGPEDFGKSCHEIYLCGRPDGENCPTISAALEGEPRTRIHEFTDAQHVWHCYQQVFTPVEHSDTRLIALTFDITEQRRQTEQMRLISKLTEKVETTLDLDRVLRMVLTCVTAGHAIGFNRAFIMLLDEEKARLEGRMAVGPTSSEDAHRIWSNLDQRDQTIDEVLDQAVFSSSDRRLTETLQQLSVPVGDRENTLVSTLRSRTSAHVGEAGRDPNMPRELTERLDLAEFACVPLSVPEEPLGVMLADNKYSGVPIDQHQVELLEMFARQASLAISNARAYERIQRQLQELHETRDRLIEAERMASVGRMASHLAHEIRNPLTAIGGFASSIARQHQDNPKTHRQANIIYDEVCRLERTLVNVLDYTRPLRPEKKPVDLNEIVRETTRQFDGQIEQNGIELQMDLSESLPEVMADAEMIKQVVINLVKNAVEAMEETEEARLRVQTAPAGEDTVQVVVADTGCGMPQEVVDDLFSPFFTTKIGGIGLGLSVSAGIVRQHGGEIDVESEAGEGSRFTVTLAVGGEGRVTGQASDSAADTEKGES